MELILCRFYRNSHDIPNVQDRPSPSRALASRATDSVDYAVLIATAVVYIHARLLGTVRTVRAIGARNF